jgi:predicted deacetylase
MSPDRKLIVSIHDVGPKFEPEIDALVDRLTASLGRMRFAMLVVPNHWGEAPLSSSRAYQAKLRRWAEAGVELFVHGWFHRDDSVHPGALTRFKARHLTAREGEFLGLGRQEALRRMCDGRRLIEDITGIPVTGFVAPAWLYGNGAREALVEAGFGIAEDHLRVWRPATDEVVARGPVITWASRSPMRIASSSLVARLAPLLLQHQHVVRLAVHPGDTGVPQLLASIDRTLALLGAYRRLAAYDDLLRRRGEPADRGYVGTPTRIVT